MNWDQTLDRTAPEVVPFEPIPAPDPWPLPDMSLISAERRDPPAFPSEVFGPWADWIANAAEVKNVPEDYVAIALLSVAGSLIGNNRFASPWPGWREPPVIWGALIGDPSAGKSPALDAVLEPLKEVEDTLSIDYEEKIRNHQDCAELVAIEKTVWQENARKAIKGGEEPPGKPDAIADLEEEPVQPRLYVSDVTTEKLAAILREQWRGLLLHRDELAGWLGNLDKYGGGGDRPFWLEAYGGRPFRVERQKNPVPISVDRLTVGVLGGIQPDRLASLLLSGDDDGMLARFVVVWPNPVPLKRPGVIDDEEIPKKAFAKLLTLEPCFNDEGRPRPYLVHFDEEAQDLLQEFRQTCREFEGESEGLMKSHVGKFSGLVIRLAVILAYLDWSIETDRPQPGKVTAKEMGRACHYVAEYLRPMALRAYGDAAAPSEERAAIQLAWIILESKWTEFGIRDVVAKKRSGLRSAKEVSAATRVLIEAGWIRLGTGPKPQRGPSRTTYAVNPSLIEEKTP